MIFMLYASAVLKVPPRVQLRFCVLQGDPANVVEKPPCLIKKRPSDLIAFFELPVKVRGFEETKVENELKMRSLY